MPDPASSYNKTLILIVDDERFMRVTFQDLLEKAGFMTAVAADGVSAISSCMQLKPDLILLDLIMPGKDGFETCQEIRSIEAGRYTPILMVTGLGDTASINRAFEAGATDFITKPVNPDLLGHRLRYMLRASLNMKQLAESEARLANAQRIAHLGNWEWDPLSGTLWGSEETFRILGMEKSTSVANFESFLSAVYPPDREIAVAAMTNACENGSSCGFECRIMTADAVQRIVSMHGQVSEPAQGKIRRLVGTLQDITEMKQVEERLVMLKEAVDRLPIGITISDVNDRIIYANPAEAEMHGYSLEELIDRDVSQFADLNLDKPHLPEKINNFGVWRREDLNIRKNGAEFPVQLSSIAVRNAEERYLGMVTLCEDITGRKKTEQRIQHLAYCDSLTGLPNRAAFHESLQHALALARREERQVGLLFLDLDNFKDVNDIHGHDFGDRLLGEVAGRLSAAMRESDTLARLGGDEFVVILAALNGQESAAVAAQRLLTLFYRPFTLECREVYSSATIGISLYPDDGLDVETLFKRADTAMYHAKTEGKAKYRFFSAEMNERIMRRVALENCLRQGMDKGEFYLQYQPQWDLKSTRMLGVEALLRWQSAELGPLMPNEFIPMAENSGQIIGLGEWAMRSACIQAREWELAGYRDFRMGVNISGLQFRQPDFLEMVGKIIRETGIAPGALDLEFTESVVMDHADKNTDILRSLKEMGVHLSIDDFGTGYSSLSYLKHFPIDRIKIDRSFVADVNQSNDGAAIVEAIISMAHSLNLKVVAEGVENSNQLRFLETRHCDEVQGFHLAMPMSADDLVGSTGWPHGEYIAGDPAGGWANDLSMEG
ncbi:MAG TPA: EAL domain-containing protein [Geobacteraceae bacterium]|nr:EAL domain-containing protein [Geobacteraceae bacterium]